MSRICELLTCEICRHPAHVAACLYDACHCGALANSVQHGGDHYKTMPIQPWDYVAANGLGYFEGTAVKYLTRWRAKGGVEDLKKAIHFIEKLIEVEEGR